MWEQRYGVPAPERTPGGYRMYSDGDVELLRRALALRERGLSVPRRARARARAAGGPTDRPSIYGAIVTRRRAGPPQLLRKRTLLAISRAIEDETLARAAGAGRVRRLPARAQLPRRRAPLPARWRQVADAAVVFADFAARARPADGAPGRAPIEPDDALGNEWAVVVDAPGYAACLLAWERPRSPREAPRRPTAIASSRRSGRSIPRSCAQAALVGCSLARLAAPELARPDRADAAPTARSRSESPAPALTALTNRLVAYLEAEPPSGLGHAVDARLMSWPPIERPT